MVDLLAIEDLHVGIPTDAGILQAVHGIDLSVAAGETVALVGESGSGKSLTSLSIVGLLPRNARRRARKLSFAGVNLLSQSPRAMEDLRGRRIGMIFQDPMTALNP